MLVERYGCFGGVLTQVGVEGYAWYHHQETVEAVDYQNNYIYTIKTIIQQNLYSHFTIA